MNSFRRLNVYKVSCCRTLALTKRYRLFVCLLLWMSLGGRFSAVRSINLLNSLRRKDVGAAGRTRKRLNKEKVERGKGQNSHWSKHKNALRPRYIFDLSICKIFQKFLFQSKSKTTIYVCWTHLCRIYHTLASKLKITLLENICCHVFFC